MWEIISVVIGRCCCDVESVELGLPVLHPPFCAPSVSIIDAGLLPSFISGQRFCQNRNAAASLLTKLKGQKRRRRVIVSVDVAHDVITRYVSSDDSDDCSLARIRLFHVKAVASQSLCLLSDRCESSAASRTWWQLPGPVCTPSTWTFAPLRLPILRMKPSSGNFSHAEASTVSRCTANANHQQSNT